MFPHVKYVQMWPYCETTPFTAAASALPPLDNLPIGSCSKWSRVMYKIRYFLLKYFMKYFGNISEFNEIFQNAMPAGMPCLFLPYQALAQNLVMFNTCNCLLLVSLLHAFYFRHLQICDFNFQIIKSRTLKFYLF